MHKMFNLPRDVVEIIVCNLNLVDFVSLASSCTRYRPLLQKEDLWRTILMRTFGEWDLCNASFVSLKDFIINLEEVRLFGERYLKRQKEVNPSDPLISLVERLGCPLVFRRVDHPVFFICGRKGPRWMPINSVAFMTEDARGNLLKDNPHPCRFVTMTPGLVAYDHIPKLRKQQRLNSRKEVSEEVFITDTGLELSSVPSENVMNFVSNAPAQKFRPRTYKIQGIMGDGDYTMRGNIFYPLVFFPFRRENIVSSNGIHVIVRRGNTKLYIPHQDAISLWGLEESIVIAGSLSVEKGEDAKLIWWMAPGYSFMWPNLNAMPKRF